MAKAAQVPTYVQVGNAVTLALLRAGVKLVGPLLFFGNYPMYLLTVPGRKSGQPRTVAIFQKGQDVYEYYRGWALP